MHKKLTCKKLGIALICSATSLAALGQSSMEEIIVSAQRRDQNVQDVPVAVTAVTAEKLAEAQVYNIADLSAVAPSVRFDAANNTAKDANIKIRGIGTAGQARSFEGAVGVFIDGVYRSRAGQALSNWLDVEGVQVLRGPQGTLFGKNTSAGAFLLTSKAPDFSGVSGDYEVSVGNYNMFMTRAAINTPITDNLAFRIAGSYLDQDGFLEDPNTGHDQNNRHPRAVKAQLLFEPSDDLSFRLIGDWSEERSNCCYGAVESEQGPTQPLVDALSLARGLRPASKDVKDYETVLNDSSKQFIKDRGILLDTTWSPTEDSSLHSITAYRKWNYTNPTPGDADFSGADLVAIDEPFGSEFFSQEFTWDGNGELGVPVDYVVGAYYSREKLTGGRTASWGSQAQFYWDTLLAAAAGLPAGTVSASAGQSFQDVSYPGENTSAAVFAHGDFELSQSWHLIAGLRYSKDRKTGKATYDSFDPAPNAVLQVLGVYPGPNFDATYDDSAITGTLTLQYFITPDTMSYATYSRGYKSGGVNLDASAAGLVANNPAITPGAVPLDPRYDAEFTDGYELGLKTTYWDHKARSNFALFYNDLKDLQIAQFLGLQFAIINAPKATVYGAEMENQFFVTDTVSLNLDAVWLGDASYDEDPILGVLSGRDFSQAPEWTANFGINLNQPISDGFNLIGRAAAQYMGEEFNNTAGMQKRDAVTQYDFSLGIQSVEAGWTLSAWCRNCSDERYVTQNLATPIQDGDFSGFVNAPRTYGMSLRGSF